MEKLLAVSRRQFAARGYGATTLAGIAGELKVTPAALLRYFPTKQALFDAAMRTKETEIPPFVFELARTDPGSDPRVVFRALVEQLIPFFIQKIEENIAVYMHSKTISLTLPLDARGAGNPPARALAVFENYFRRARRAGAIRDIDPRAAATLFVGSLHSYVFVNYIFKATPVPLPIPRFVDAMIDLWSHGAFTDRPPSKVKAGGKRGKKPETGR